MMQRNTRFNRGKNRGKKGQIAGQIFIYVIAIVVVGLIIAYGYSAIKSFSKRGEEVEYITLRTGIENSVKGIISDYGSVSRPDISVSGKYEYVCFADKNKKDDAENTGLCGGDPSVDPTIHQPVACSAWKTGRSNVFLIPDGSENFDAGDIIMDSNLEYLCLEVINNKINLQLEGLGDKVRISEYQKDN